MASTGAKKRVKPGKNLAAIPSSINPPPALAPPAFDLVALRAAALNSKKRKAAAEASSSSSKKSRPEESVHILEDDMEEGEIEGDGSEEGELTGARDSDIVFLEEEDDDDDLIIIEPSDPPVRLALHPTTSQTSRQPSPSTYPSEYRRESVQTPSIEHIRDEAIQVIRQLLDHGVSPEYLVDYGVSKDIIAIAFHELGLLLPTHLAHSAPCSPPHDPNSSLAIDSIQPAINPNFKPRLSVSPPPSDYYYNNPPPPIDSAELMATEARKKEELLARKRALAGRNAEKADSFLDTLFSASLPVAAPVASGSSASSSTSSPRISPPVLLAASSVSRTRESSHETEGISSRRPVAIDFEALPPKSSAPPRRTALAYIDEEVSRPKKLVIEFSESESESDSEDEDAEVLSSIVTRTILPNAPSAQSLPKLPLSATTPSTPTIPSFETIIEAKEADVQKELGAKELEIKMIMEKIAQMSKRKKSSNGTASGGSTPVLTARTAPAVPKSASQVSLSNPLPMASTSQLIQGGGSEKDKRVAVEAALKIVDVLQVERSLLMKEAEAIVEKREGAELDVDETEGPPLEVHKNEIPSGITKVEHPTTTTAVPTDTSFFKPYKSPLELLPAALPSTVLDIESLSPAVLQSWVARKKGLDTSRRMCKYETQNGSCSDASCKSNHFASFVASETDLTAFLLESIRLPATASAVKQALFLRGLELTLQAVSRPLTLDNALKSASAYYQDSMTIGRPSS